MQAEVSPDRTDTEKAAPPRAGDPTRLRFAAIVALLGLLITGLTSLNAYQIRAASQERSEVTTANLIGLVERQVYDTLSKVDMALQTAAIEIDRELARDSEKAQSSISEFLARQHALLPEAAGYRATDEYGIVRYGEGIPAGSTVSLAEREYFKYLRDTPDANRAVFGPVYAQISKQWTVAIARALRDERGQFQGIVVATISVDEFQKNLNLLNLGVSGAATLRMADMALIARATPLNKGRNLDYGSKQTSAQLARAIAENPEKGSYVAVTALDGIERINAYKRVANYPMYVIIGIATQDMEPEWRKQTIFVLILGFIAIAITALGATSIARQRRREFRERLSEASRYAELLEKIAHHDTLTGLPNRALLQDRYQQAIALHFRRTQMLAVAFLDLDGFKVINDTYGHAAGDQLLVELASRMKAALREGDTLARLGGDEFVAIMTDLSAQADATVILQRLLAACSNPVTMMGAQVQVSASIGVVFAPAEGSDLDLLLRKADQAMYLAKQSGRNQFRFFEE